MRDHCTSCDPFSQTAPICVDGDAFSWSGDDLVTTPCPCGCHGGGLSDPRSSDHPSSPGGQQMEIERELIPA